MSELSDVYGKGVQGWCPHCGRWTRFDPTSMSQRYYSQFSDLSLYSKQSEVKFSATQCTLCDGIVAWVRSTHGEEEPSEIRMVPLGGERQAPKGTPPIVATVFRRATKLSGIDSTAAAAFIRTCLEKVLDDQGVLKTRPTQKGEVRLSLYARLGLFLAQDTLLRLATRTNIDLIRTSGNFIHLNENLATGDVEDITDEETGWVTSVMHEIFEDLYVKPVTDAAMRASFEAKNQAVGN